MKNTDLRIGLLIVLAGLPVAYAAPNFSVGEQAEIVTAHNNWRSQVNIPRLHWSPTIAELAQSYADSLKSNEDCQPSHSATDLGENLFWASPITYSDGRSEFLPMTPARVIDDWGGEKDDYDSASNTCAIGKVCGHYTQMVWKSTTEIGCGKAVCPDNSQIWVCNYRPAGNIVGQHPYR
jgi:pathogenesis-related protein 1